MLSCRATSNHKVKETVALELSYVNSNLQLLKEELEELNSSMDVYQNDRYTEQPSQAGSSPRCRKSSLLTWDFIFIIIVLLCFFWEQGSLLPWTCCSVSLFCTGFIALARDHEVVAGEQGRTRAWGIFAVNSFSSWECQCFIYRAARRANSTAYHSRYLDVQGWMVHPLFTDVPKQEE